MSQFAVVAERRESVRHPTLIVTGHGGAGVQRVVATNDGTDDGGQTKQILPRNRRSGTLHLLGGRYTNVYSNENNYSYVG